MANLRGRTEKDTCTDYVLPALTASGWTEVMIRPEYAVKHDRVTSIGGVTRTIGDGRVDYVLEAVPGVPTAAVEAKREYSTPSQGLQQAIRYAQQLDAPLAYSTNGHGFVERNLMTGSECALRTLPTPAEMWSTYAEWHGLNADGQELLAEPFNRNRTDVAGNVIEPRWYQTMAVHRVLRAMTAGQNRILLLMATGTGKTLTAMQIVAKLRAYEQARRPERNYRVLYLADLDVLLKQPMEKDFKSAFRAEPLHRVLGGKNTSREIYFSSYQALTGQGVDSDKLFSDYDPDFFDLVIVDECHRGSAKADGQWRQILDHFTSAVQIGLTAAPKRTREIDSYDYFGDAVFEYSLRQGIEDGYLAPYRVRRVLLSPDVDGWEPVPGELDRYQRDIPDGVYSTLDFERVLSLLKRTELAAGHLSGLLRSVPGRAMIFCVDQQHAEDMRAAMVKVNPDMVRADPEWVVRIVGSIAACSACPTGRPQLTTPSSDGHYGQTAEESCPTSLPSPCTSSPTWSRRTFTSPSRPTSGPATVPSSSTWQTLTQQRSKTAALGKSPRLYGRSSTPPLRISPKSTSTPPSATLSGQGRSPGGCFDGLPRARQRSRR